MPIAAISQVRRPDGGPAWLGDVMIFNHSQGANHAASNAYINGLLMQLTARWRATVDSNRIPGIIVSETKQHKS